MKRWLLFLLIVIPVLEIMIFMQIGHVIGGGLTFLLVIASSVLGAYLLKKQGMRTINLLRQEVAMGMIPGETLLDGACVLAGGILLLVPGFLTDVLGLLLILPIVRAPFKGLLKLWLVRLLTKGRITVYRR